MKEEILQTPQQIIFLQLKVKSKECPWHSWIETHKKRIHNEALMIKVGYLLPFVTT